ncbi:unnamed protein product [Urochloa humidicola]
MAPPSNKRVLIAVLIAFALAAASPQPSVAFSIPPIIPCLRGLPRIPFLPCREPEPLPPQKLPTECWPPLMKLATPCAGFLTNSTVPAPPSACCDGYQSVIDDAGICLCHVGNGDIHKLLPAPLNLTRMFEVPQACGNAVGLKAFTDCNMDDVPPMTPPAKTAPPPTF